MGKRRLNYALLNELVNCGIQHYIFSVPSQIIEVRFIDYKNITLIIVQLNTDAGSVKMILLKNKGVSFFILFL